MERTRSSRRGFSLSLRALVIVLSVFGLLGVEPTLAQDTKRSVCEGEDLVLDCPPANGHNLESTGLHIKFREHHRSSDDTPKEVFYYDGGKCDFSDQDKQFGGRVIYFERDSSMLNATVVISPVTMADAGVYSCNVIRQPVKNIPRYSTEVVVEPTYKDWRGLKKGAVNPPYLKFIEDPVKGLKLECKVIGSSSKPELKLQTCNGTVLPAAEQHTSNKSGRFEATRVAVLGDLRSACCFECVVNQMDIRHVIKDNITLLDEFCISKSRKDCTAGGGPGRDVGFVLVGAVVTGICVSLHALIRRRRPGDRPHCNGELKQTPNKTANLDQGVL